MSKNRQNGDMLAFTYRLQKIIRDMKYVQLADEDAALKREALVDSLQDTCRRIEEEFG